VRLLVEAWCRASVRAIPVLLVIGCAAPLALEGRHCPCAEGYQCCESGNLCLRETQTCPSWKALDRESLEALDFDGNATGWDFEIGPDGTPYVVVIHCVSGDCFEPTRRVPEVLRYEGGGWTRLPSEGLPETAWTPNLLVARDGTPRLFMNLSDQPAIGQRSIVVSFDGARWEEHHAPILGTMPTGLDAPGPFLEDAESRLYVCVLTEGDPSTSFSVMRSEGSEWQTLGSPLVGESLGVELAERDGALCVKHLDSFAGTTLLQCLEGSDWPLVREFEGYLAQGLWIGPDGSRYVVQSEFLESWVLRGKGDEWTEFPLVMSQGADLVVTSDGGLFLLAKGHDFYSRVAVWDAELGAWSYFTTEGYDAFPFTNIANMKLVVAPNEPENPYLAFQVFDTDERTKFLIWRHE
jgi:hypothetical protein